MDNSVNNRQPWLYNSTVEFIFILLPPLLPVLLLFIFKNYFTSHTEVSSLWWVILVVFVDVAHVYSTVFRMYWDQSIFNKHKKHLLIIPIVGVGIGFSLHMIDGLVFWRMLTYLAVFHFIRQQYGFMRIYARHESVSQAFRIVDALCIYSATLYPLLYWHLNLTDKLAWFVEGDFISLNLVNLGNFPFYIYALIAIVYIGKEIWMLFKTKTFNIPKNLVVVGTYLSWYVGIVLFNGDLAFTMLNVLAHGIPYMALVWIYGEKKSGQGSRFKFNLTGLSIFVGVILVFSYLEEGIWDILVWKDHTDIFPVLTTLPTVENPVLLAILVPVLTLPQFTHYVLDGFIWRHNTGR